MANDKIIVAVLLQQWHDLFHSIVSKINKNKLTLAFKLILTSYLQIFNVGLKKFLLNHIRNKLFYTIFPIIVISFFPGNH